MHRNHIWLPYTRRHSWKFQRLCDEAIESLSFCYKWQSHHAKINCLLTIRAEISTKRSYHRRYLLYLFTEKWGDEIWHSLAAHIIVPAISVKNISSASEGRWVRRECQMNVAYTHAYMKATCEISNEDRLALLLVNDSVETAHYVGGSTEAEYHYIKFLEIPERNDMTYWLFIFRLMRNAEYFSILFLSWPLYISSMRNDGAHAQ